MKAPELRQIQHHSSLLLLLLLSLLHLLHLFLHTVFHIYQFISNKCAQKHLLLRKHNKMHMILKLEKHV